MGSGLINQVKVMSSQLWFRMGSGSIFQGKLMPIQQMTPSRSEGTPFRLPAWSDLDLGHIFQVKVMLTQQMPHPSGQRVEVSTAELCTPWTLQYTVNRCNGRHLLLLLLFYASCFMQ